MNRITKVAAVAVAVAVWVGLAVLMGLDDHADGATGHRDQRPCASGAEYRELRQHDGASRRSWSVDKVQRFVDAPGHVEQVGEGTRPLTLSWPICRPCKGLKLVGYFERFGGKLRLLSMSRWSNFVETPPPAECYE